MNARAAPSVELDARHLLAQPERHVLAPQHVLERLADLVVEEAQDAIALVDDRDLGAERAEHRCVLDADHAGADDDHRARDTVLELQQPVGIDDRAVVELDLPGPRRPRTAGDDDPLRADRLVRIADLDGTGVLEVSLAGQKADAVAAELLAHHRGLRRHHACGAVHQQLEHGLLGLLHARGVEHVERALGELLEYRLAQGLGRDRAGVDGDAAEPLLALRDRHPLAELGGLDRGLLAARPGSDHEKIELHDPHRTLYQACSTPCPRNFRRRSKASGSAAP